jgi:hypothetical protein
MAAVTEKPALNTLVFLSRDIIHRPLNLNSF